MEAGALEELQVRVLLDDRDELRAHGDDEIDLALLEGGQAGGVLDDRANDQLVDLCLLAIEAVEAVHDDAHTLLPRGNLEGAGGDRHLTEGVIAGGLERRRRDDRRIAVGHLRQEGGVWLLQREGEPERVTSTVSMP